MIDANALGATWPPLGPHQHLFWLRRGDDGLYLLTENLDIRPGVPTARLHGLLAAELFGDFVYDLAPAEPARVWICSGRSREPEIPNPK